MRNNVSHVYKKKRRNYSNRKVLCYVYDFYVLSKINICEKGARKAKIINLKGLTSTQKYSERRYFRAVHIFASFAFIKCPRKYVHRENNFGI